MTRAGFSWKSRWTALIHDLLSIPVAWFVAYWLRFNLDSIPPDIFDQSIKMLPALMVPQAVGFWYFGLYRGVWRFASLADLVRIIKAVAMGSLLSLLTLFLVFRLEHLPRSVFPMYTTILLMALGGSRFLYRWYKDKKAPIGKRYERVLIVGLEHGESLCRDLLRHVTPYVPVAFVDDRDKDQGREIHGVRVMGKSVDIPKLVRKLEIDVIMVALPNANAKEMRRIHSLCESTAIPVHTLPGIGDLVSGRVTVKSLRKISLEDLLGRDPISLDRKAIETSLAGKTVIISGGAGSIGSELCRQVINYNPKELIIVDNNEYHLFLIEQEFKELSDKVKISRALIDICDEVGITTLFNKFRPQVVFHAAAYKHVPLLQDQIRAAIRNNVLGTMNIARASVNVGVERFILVSSDKAVNPTNIMGATKRVAELVCQMFNETKTHFVTVRFGNVLGSRGSVVETFQQQLEKGGPLTVTHPDMTRYFMTTKEACQLILQASALGERGELYVLDMGEAVSIRYMAEQMIRLAGKKPDEDIAIEYVGLREGEKLYEELFHNKEQLMPTPHVKILRAMHRTLDYDLLMPLLEKLETSCEENNVQALNLGLITLVPEFAHAFHADNKKSLEPA